MTGIVNARFTPAPPWLTGTLQTVADRVHPRTHDLAAASTAQRLVVGMGDGSGDALAVRIHRPRVGPRPDRPLVLVVHGLGGSIESTYVRAVSLGLLRAGYVVARVDLRGVGDSSEHCQMLYHGGRSEDLRTVLRALADERHAIGGNVTLKLLGEPLDRVPVRAGVAVSAPLD
ncbi:MAG TPA: hypothetical protein VLQ92_02390, partial [Candidatus Limnocylindrales bacterium]|nr:hypothetical protein [Candidatus Limnocylindrales bacterium]